MVRKAGGACSIEPRIDLGISKQRGRFSVTLYMFLQQHYASNGSSAWALTSAVRVALSTLPMSFTSLKSVA